MEISLVHRGADVDVLRSKAMRGYTILFLAINNYWIYEGCVKDIRF